MWDFIIIITWVGLVGTNQLMVNGFQKWDLVCEIFIILTEVVVPTGHPMLNGMFT